MYEGVTFESILDRMLSRIPSVMDKREGSVIYDALAPAAIELQNIYIEFDVILNETFGDTASRTYLIRRAAERGITPYPASKAVAKAVCSPTDVVIDKGSRFSLGDRNYSVSEKISDGVYKLECETPGSEGNNITGTLIPIDYISGLETITFTELLIPGEDEEDTEDLRKRYFDSFKTKAFGGNVQDYLEKTNAVPGVGSVKVTRVWNGDISPSALIPSNAVKNWYEFIIDALDGDPKKWLETVYNAAKNKKLTTGGTVLLTILNSDFGLASDALIQTVQQTIDPNESTGEGYGLAPIGHVVNVKSAESVNVKIKVDITFDTGYDWGNLQSSINTIISDYLLELRKSWADNPYLIVRISQIETRLLSIKGIVDVDGTTINGIADNLTLDKYEVPVFGGASA